MSYELFEHDRVTKFYKNHKNEQELLLRINKVYKKILKNPYSSLFKQLNTTKCPKCHRARVGDYRLIFYINERKKEIEIIDIISRKNNYRFFIF